MARITKQLSPVFKNKARDLSELAASRIIRYLEGVPLKTISYKDGVTSSAVKYTLSQAKIKLRVIKGAIDLPNSYPSLLAASLAQGLYISMSSEEADIMRHLTDKQKEILELRVRGFLQKDIRGSLDISDSAYKQRVGGIRAKFKKEYLPFPASLRLSYAAVVAHDGGRDYFPNSRVYIRGEGEDLGKVHTGQSAQGHIENTVELKTFRGVIHPKASFT